MGVISIKSKVYSRNPSAKPKVFYNRSVNKWMLRICRDEWYCYLGWAGAMGFLYTLYKSGDVERIQNRSAV